MLAQSTADMGTHKQDGQHRGVSTIEARRILVAVAKRLVCSLFSSLASIISMGESCAAVAPVQQYSQLAIGSTSLDCCTAAVALRNT